MFVRAFVLLLAGSNWDNGASCGSRSRNAASCRWNTAASLGGRAGVDTGKHAGVSNPWLNTKALSQGKIQKRRMRRVSRFVESQAHQKYQMKRYGNLYDKITDIENIRTAYLKARKGKSWQRTVKNFEAQLEDNLLKIQDMLINQTFTTSAYTTRIIHEPKERIIYKLPFSPDRIVQHAIMNVVEPIWESFFVYASYACRKHKGIHAGSKRTMEFVRRNQYCLKGDMAKFYPSINHDVLYAIVRRKIKDERLLALLKNIIYSIDGETNCPIGNYTSQWFGNLYLNELDQRVKHVYKIRDYIRYCDDFLLFSNDKRQLKTILDDLENYIGTALKLRLSKKDIFPVSRGVDFLGYRHFPKYILLRKSTTKRVKKRVKQLPWLREHGYLTKEQYRSSLASTLGWMKWANCHNLRQKLGIDRLLAENV